MARIHEAPANCDAGDALNDRFALDGRNVALTFVSYNL